MKPITIIGGGLAGLTLGVALRQNGVPVTIIEAGHYPRHRVCGEFISGDGESALERCGLTEVLRELGAKRALDAAFFVSNARIGTRLLPAPAVCVSRYSLDAKLSRYFQQRGGELREGERCAILPSPGVVRATGRQAQPTERGWRWFGLKIHAKGIPLEADLEMHLSRDSYVGLCRLPDDEVNICGLFRCRPGQTNHGESLDKLRGAPGSLLFSRLKSAEFDPASLCAVAGLSFRSRPIDHTECRIGDALAMIPPITGNGMSMAFESARIALEPLVEYAQERKDWESVTKEIADLLHAQFSRRLKCAWRLHQLMFSPLRGPAVQLLFRSSFATLFALTR